MTPLVKQRKHPDLWQLWELTLVFAVAVALPYCGYVLARPAAVGVSRVDEASGRGVAIATRSNDRYTKLDPYNGAIQSLAAAYRAVAIAGATPLAITDGLNFGSPEDPDAMWQFAEALSIYSHSAGTILCESNFGATK